MAIKVVEERGESSTFDWEKVAATFEPETKDLPKEDRLYYESRIKFLIGKLIRLANIKREHYLYYTDHGAWILMIHRYPMLFYEEYFRTAIAQFMNELGLTLSIYALGYKFGPMSYQIQHVKQEIIGAEKVGKK